MVSLSDDFTGHSCCDLLCKVHVGFFIRFKIVKIYSRVLDIVVQTIAERQPQGIWGIITVNKKTFNVDSVIFPHSLSVYPLFQHFSGKVVMLCKKQTSFPESGLEVKVTTVCVESCEIPAPSSLHRIHQNWRCTKLTLSELEVISHTGVSQPVLLCVVLFCACTVDGIPIQSSQWKETISVPWRFSSCAHFRGLHCSGK